MKEFFEKFDFEKIQLMTTKQTVWTQILIPTEMLVLICSQTNWHSDSVPERIFMKKLDFEKKQKPWKITQHLKFNL